MTMLLFLGAIAAIAWLVLAIEGWLAPMPRAEPEADSVGSAETPAPGGAA